MVNRRGSNDIKSYFGGVKKMYEKANICVFIKKFKLSDGV